MQNTETFSNCAGNIVGQKKKKKLFQIQVLRKQNGGHAHFHREARVKT